MPLPLLSYSFLFNLPLLYPSFAQQILALALFRFTACFNTGQLAAQAHTLVCHQFSIQNQPTSTSRPVVTRTNSLPTAVPI